MTFSPTENECVALNGKHLLAHLWPVGLSNRFADESNNSSWWAIIIYGLVISFAVSTIRIARKMRSVSGTDAFVSLLLRASGWSVCATRKRITNAQRLQNENRKQPSITTRGSVHSHTCTLTLLFTPLSGLFPHFGMDGKKSSSGDQSWSGGFVARMVLLADTGSFHHVKRKELHCCRWLRSTRSRLRSVNTSRFAGFAQWNGKYCRRWNYLSDNKMNSQCACARQRSICIPFLVNFHNNNLNNLFMHVYGHRPSHSVSAIKPIPCNAINAISFRLPALISDGRRNAVWVRPDWRMDIKIQFECIFCLSNVSRMGCTCTYTHTQIRTSARAAH